MCLFWERALKLLLLHFRGSLALEPLLCGVGGGVLWQPPGSQGAERKAAPTVSALGRTTSKASCIERGI